MLSVLVLMSMLHHIIAALITIQILEQLSRLMIILGIAGPIIKTTKNQGFREFTR
jgi:hypothetical protein